MINYYYEIKDDVTVFGRKDLKYVALFDAHPGRPNGINWQLHDEALKHSTRAWLENANGISLVKSFNYNDVWDQVDPVEFTWIKLRCYDIEEL